MLYYIMLMINSKGIISISLRSHPFVSLKFSQPSSSFFLSSCFLVSDSRHAVIHKTSGIPYDSKTKFPLMKLVVSSVRPTLHHSYVMTYQKSTQSRV